VAGRKSLSLFLLFEGIALLMAVDTSAEPQDERAPSAGAKSLAIPFDQSQWTPIEPGKTKCPACGRDAKRWTMFGRSY
jgi:prolyl-tRNA synthetase